MTTQAGRHVEDQAWVTLATNDTYGLGALVLARSLVRVATSRKLAILVTPGVTAAMRSHLGEVFDHVKEVNVLDSSDAANLALLTRPDLGITFTKLHCWRLTQFNKCVFMDADTLVLQNCDELFDREELSAAPDVGWPDCFNSGVFVYRPSNETYEALVQCALTIGSFDGGDQGLLNVYFRDWATKDINKHLPFVYNMTSSAAYSYLPAYLHFGKDVKVVHFIGPVKPWNHHYDTSTGKVDQHPGAFHLLEHLQIWWDIFVADVQPHLQPELRVETKTLEAVTGQAGLAMFLSQLSLGAALSPELKSQEDRARQFAWEQGHIDYMGADAFANIQRKLDENIVVIEEPTISEPQAESTPSELKSLPTESEPQAITDSSSAEPVSIVSCPLAVPTTPVHRSSIHLSEPLNIPDKPADDDAAAAEAEPASSIPVSTRMEIIPAIPRTPPIVPSTPIMLPPPPSMSVPPTPPVAGPAPGTPSVTPATPGIPVPDPKIPSDSPSAVSALPHPVSPIPSTPPAAGPVAQSKAIPTSASVAPTTTVPTTPPAVPVTPASAISPPPLPPRAPVPAPEAAAPSTPAKPAKKSSPEKPDVASGATGEAASKPGAKKQQPKGAAAAVAAAAPAAPVRKGDKGKPSKK